MSENQILLLALSGFNALWMHAALIKDKPAPALVSGLIAIACLFGILL